MRGLQFSHSRHAWRRGASPFSAGGLSTHQLARGFAVALGGGAKVASFGDGSHGALGHRDCFGGDSYEPQEVPGLPDDTVSVGAGHYHSMAVSKSGQLWAWGRNSEGQLGPRDNAINSREKWHVPQLVRGLESVEVVAARGSGVVSMAIGRDGSLWVWGKSKRGQLGLGTNITHAHTPQQVEALKEQHVVQVALGWGHALALTTQGQVYSWGYAANGRLGFQPPCSEPQRHDRSPTTSGEAAVEDAALRQVLQEMEKERRPVLAWEPVRVDALVGVTQVSCGMDHSLTLNEQGELWSFGDNSLGQLGRPVAIPTSNTFTGTNPVERVQGPLTREIIVNLGAGLGHSLAVSSQGSVHSWGWNAGHQLGRDGSSAMPGPVAGWLQEEAVTKVSGGRAHSVGLTAKGALWVWGSGKNGRLGLGSPADERYPELLEVERVADVTCGFDHTLVLLP